MDRLELQDRIVDFRREQVRGRDGAPVELRPRAFGVLRRLALASGALVTKDELLRECWPGVTVTEDSLTQCISEIRRALGEGGRDLVRTVPRRGYSLLLPETAPPAVVAPAPSPSPVEVAEPTSRDKATAERRRVTVLFCDLAGSTALSSRLDPEDLDDVLKRFLRCAGDVIAHWGGYVANELGDGVLAYFGYPSAHEDDAERAAQAGLELEQAIGRLAMRDGATLSVRVGIATGLVVVRSDTGSARSGAVGETPNRAARLQEAAEPGIVLVDEATRERLDALFECRQCRAFRAAGLTQPLQAWRIVRRVEPHTRSGVVHAAARATPLVGRAAELGFLYQRWRYSRAGEGQVVLLSGEPGIGKSRLAAALIEELSGEPHVVVRHFCSPYHRDSPLFPILDQLGRAADFTTQDGPQARLDKLTAALAPALGGQDGLALIAETMGLPGAGPTAFPDLSPQRRRERLLQALLSQLVGLAAQQPVLLLFEDAHWSDPTSLDLLSLAVEPIRHLPVMLLVTFRPEFQTSWSGLPHVTALVLGGLSRAEAALLAAHSAKGSRLTDSVIGEIIERTAGVPLFVEELTRAIVDADWHDTPKAGAAPPSAPGCLVPAALYGPLATRLDRLGGSAREVAQIGAVIGRQFGYELLAAVADRPETELREALRRLVEAGLLLNTSIDSPRAGYRFKHALVRDAAYGTLLHARRRQLHKALASALERLSPELAESQPEVLAQHYEGAGSFDEAVESWSKAGHRAIAGSAMVEARAHLEHGLALAKQIEDVSVRTARQAELYLALGNVEMATHGYGAPEHGAQYAEAVRLCRMLGPEYKGSSRLLTQALVGEYAFKIHVGQITASHAVAEELIRLGRRHPDMETRTLAAAAYGSSCLFRGRLLEGAAVCAAAAAEPEIAADAAPMLGFGVDAPCQLLTQYSRLLACQGRVGEAREQMHSGTERARRLRHLPTTSTCMSSCCDTAWFLRDLDGLRQLSSELVQLAREQGFKYWLAKSRCYMGWVTAMDGSCEQGRAMLLEGMRELADIGVLFYAHTRVMLAEVLARLGEPDAALAAVDVGLNLCAQTGECWTVAELHRQKGELLATRDAAMAAASLKEAIRIARLQSARLFEVRSSVSLAHFWRNQGRLADAHALLGPLLSSSGDECAAFSDWTSARKLKDELAAVPVAAAR